MSRTSSYSHEQADQICDLLAEGKGLVEICQRSDMPHRSTVLRWLDCKPEFAARVARAREAQADYVHDEMARIEADVEAGRLPPDVARVVISSKQWRAAKLSPRKFGDRTSIETSATVRVETTRRLDISQLSDLELDALENALRVTVMQLAAPKVIEHEE